MRRRMRRQTPAISASPGRISPLIACFLSVAANCPANKLWNPYLSSAFRSEDHELDQILRALDDLSDIVKSKKLIPQPSMTL